VTLSDREYDYWADENGSHIDLGSTDNHLRHLGDL
jgi:hypothetical protein